MQGQQAHDVGQSASEASQSTTGKATRNHPRRTGLVATLVVILLLGTCGTVLFLALAGVHHARRSGTQVQSNATPSPAPSPRPPKLATMVPANYRVVKVRRSSIDAGQVPVEVVVSRGPVNQTSWRPDDLRILVWNATAGHWTIALDARKVDQPVSPNSYSWDTSNGWPFYLQSTGGSEEQALLPRNCIDDVTRVQLADMAPPVGDVVIFSAGVSPGFNNPVELAVVGFSDGRAHVGWVWVGLCNQFNPQVHILGRPGDQTIRVTAPLGSAVDSMGADARPYHFLLKATPQGVRVVNDDRPWLGALVQPDNSSPRSALIVRQVVSGSPADGHLKAGDRIVSVNGKVPPFNADTLGPALIDQVEQLYAGGEVTLGVGRGSTLLQVRVRLGSVMDPSAQNVGPPADSSSILF
jgi:hypothetical protein